MSKSSCSQGGWVILSVKFQGEWGVAHQRLLASENISHWAITWCCLRDPTFRERLDLAGISIGLLRFLGRSVLSFVSETADFDRFRLIVPQP